MKALLSAIRACPIWVCGIGKYDLGKALNLQKTATNRQKEGVFTCRTS
jgi:hypothetical protein